MPDLTTEQRSRAVGHFYGYALDHGAYGLAAVFEPDEDAVAIIGIANELLDLELQHREGLWVALERLLSFVPKGGIWRDALGLQDDEQRAQARQAAIDCGWLPERLTDDEDTP